MLKRWISPSLFALTALCFALPFATVSCDNATTSFTGLQLVTRTVPDGGVIDEPPDCSGELGACVERRASTVAELTLAAVLLGVVLGCFGVVRGPGWLAALGLGGLFDLVLIDPLAVERLQAGYILAVLLLLAGGLIHLAWAIGRVRRRRAVRSAREHGARAPG